MKMVIDGIETNKYNQIDGTVNFSVDGLYNEQVNDLILSLCNTYNHVDVEQDNRLLIHLNYMDNKYYGYIKCKN